MGTAFRLSWIIFAIALIAAILGYALWNGEPLTSVSITGETGTKSAAMAFFLYPALHFFSLAVAHASVRARPLMRVTQFRNVVVIGTALGMGLGPVLMIASISGIDVHLVPSMSTVVGLIIIACGNYLPKCAREDSIGLSRPWNYLFSIPWNLPLAYLFGIRTWWTLANDHVWNRTHRLASRLWIIGGLIFVFAGWFVTGRNFLNLISLAWTIITIVPIVYSFCLWRADQQRAPA
jgi:uncharacterized membrane protein